MVEKKPTETPMMKQYFAMKAEHPEAVLLFRCGDFYETYGEDALTASKVLGIVLTKRSSATPGAIPMAGFPHHREVSGFRRIPVGSDDSFSQVDVKMPQQINLPRNLSKHTLYVYLHF